MNGIADTSSRWRSLHAALREFPPLLWSFLYFFFLLTGYYLLRPVRDALGSTLDLQWLFTATFVCMLLLQPVYGALVSRFPRRVFLPLVYSAFIFCLVLFYFGFAANSAWIGEVFFVWVAVFNLFAVSVFWSFMADIYTDSQARRLYGYIAAGGTLGGFVGPVITRALVDEIGVPNLLLVSASLLALCIGCIVRLRPWALKRERERGQVNTDETIGGSTLAGLRLIAREPLLRAMSLLMFFGVGVGTLLYNEQAAIARSYFPDAETRTAYYASVDLAINVVTISVQLLLTRWLFTRFGIAPLLLIPAGAIMLGFAVLTASPLPFLIATVQVLTRAGDFSLGKPARESIYTRVEREARYKAKAAIDTLVYRGGDLSFVWLHKYIAVYGSSAVFGTGILVAIGMGVGAWRLFRAQARLNGAPSVAPSEVLRS